MKYCVLFGENFEEIEAVTQIDILRRAGIKLDIFGVGTLELKGKNDIVLKTEKVFNKKADIKTEEYEGIILPGGPGVMVLAENKEVVSVVEDFYNKGKLVFAVCAAPLVLHKAGVLRDKRFTCYPSTVKEITTGKYVNEKVVVDGKVITSQGVGTSIDAALKLVEIIISKESSEKISKGIVYK